MSRTLWDCENVQMDGREMDSQASSAAAFAVDSGHRLQANDCVGLAGCPPPISRLG